MIKHLVLFALCVIWAHPTMADEFGARFSNSSASGFEDPEEVNDARAFTHIEPAAGQDQNGFIKKLPADKTLDQKLKASEKVLKELNL